jgi:dTDP-4-dehydrorhamnose 3,5-epimerase-like enzyme
LDDSRTVAWVYLIRSRSAHLRDDDELRIAWPVPKARAILSERDRKHPLLRDLPASA